MNPAKMRRLLSNRLVWATAAGTLVWFADQPTVGGYNPLFQMFWESGFWRQSQGPYSPLFLLVGDRAVLPFCLLYVPKSSPPTEQGLRQPSLVNPHTHTKVSGCINVSTRY